MAWMTASAIALRINLASILKVFLCLCSILDPPYTGFTEVPPGRTCRLFTDGFPAYEQRILEERTLAMALRRNFAGLLKAFFISAPHVFYSTTSTEDSRYSERW
jgi:hypothetical protein